MPFWVKCDEISWIIHCPVYHSAYTTCLFVTSLLVAGLTMYHCAYVQGTLFYLIMGAEHKSNDAGISDMPERSHKVLPSSENVCVCRAKHNIQGSELPGISGIHWGSWNVSPVDKGVLLYFRKCPCPNLKNAGLSVLEIHWDKNNRNKNSLT